SRTAPITKATHATALGCISTIKKLRPIPSIRTTPNISARAPKKPSVVEDFPCSGSGRCGCWFVPVWRGFIAVLLSSLHRIQPKDACTSTLMIAGHFRKGAMCQLAWVYRRVIEQSPYGAVPGYRLHTHRCLTQRPPRRPREISRSDVGMLHGRAHWKYESQW